MTTTERDNRARELFEYELNVLQSKGTDYSGDTDCLSNFKRLAAELGLSKYQVWLVYFTKHLDSIRNAIRANPDTPRVASEPLTGRILDARNYLLLLDCMLLEDAQGGTP